MRWPRRRTATAIDVGNVHDRFADDYLNRFDALCKVTTDAGVYVTERNLGMFHQGALRFAEKRAAERGESVPDLETFAATLYVKARGKHQSLRLNH